MKVVEEPPEGVTIVIGIPSLGMLIPTLRSRLLPLPEEDAANDAPAAGPSLSSSVSSEVADQFLALSGEERKKHVATLLERVKSDKDTVANEARTAIAELLKGLMAHAHSRLRDAQTPAARADIATFLEDLSAFMPLLYERSVPLKLILEHTLLVIPTRSPKS